MTDRAKIITIYTVTGMIAVSVLSASVWLRRSFQGRALQEAQERLVRDTGGARPDVLWRIQGDLTGKNQDGESVNVSALRDKVWIAAQFYATCPQCAQRNGDHLLELYRKYAHEPDFHVVCFSVDPEHDTVEHLHKLAEGLGIETKNWWFLTGNRNELHEFTEQGMGFVGVKERVNEEEIAAFGRYAHDLSVAVIDRGLVMRAKCDLLGLKTQGAGLYDEGIKQITSAIEKSLAGGYPKPTQDAE